MVRRTPLIGVLALGLFLVPVSRADARLIPVAVAYSSLSASNSPLWVATDAGAFEKQGLDVTPILTVGATRALAALLGGSVSIVETGTTAVVLARSQGASVFIIGGVMNTMPFHLIVTPNISSAADLRGKTLGVSRFGSMSDLAVRLAVHLLGLNPEKDVKILQVGTAITRFAAMKRGALDGTVVETDLLPEAKSAGFKVLLSLAKRKIPFQFIILASTRQIINGKRDMLDRFMRGWVEGLKIYRSNEDLVVKTLAKYTKISSKKDLKLVYENYRNAFALPPIPSNKGIQAIIDALKGKGEGLGHMKPADVLNLSIVERLKKEGVY